MTNPCKQTDTNGSLYSLFPSYTSQYAYILLNPNILKNENWVVPLIFSFKFELNYIEILEV